MKSVIILTIPRSCSSLLGGILYRMGVWMGPLKDMIKGRHLNKYGCYENQDFLQIELNYLFNLDLLLNYINRVQINEKQLSKEAAHFKQKYIEAIKRNQKKLWGFKDGGLIYIIPYIHDLIPNPYFIHLERDHYSTAMSIRKSFGIKVWFHEIREKFPHFSLITQIKIVTRSIKMFVTRNKRMYDDNFYQKMVEIGHLRIREFTKDKKVLHLYASDIVNDTENVIQKIASFLKITVSEKQKLNAYNFIHPELINN